MSIPNVFRFVSSTGFVGIGTNNPVALLDVSAGAVAGSNFTGLGAGLSGLNATGITTGTLPAARLPTTGVTPATYGSASTVAQVTVDATGRLTTVTNTNIAIASTAVSGLAASATTDTTNATNIGTGTLNAARLPPSGVTPATYGSASTVAQVTVDATGRVTSAASTAIALAGSAITSGTIPATVLPPSGVTPATYGSASTVAQITVDAYGRITAASSVPLNVSPGVTDSTGGIFTLAGPPGTAIPPGTLTLPASSTHIRCILVGGGPVPTPPPQNSAQIVGVIFNRVPNVNTISYTIGQGGTSPGAAGNPSTITYNGITYTAQGGGNPFNPRPVTFDPNVYGFTRAPTGPHVYFGYVIPGTAGTSTTQGYPGSILIEY